MHFSVLNTQSVVHYRRNASPVVMVMGNSGKSKPLWPRSIEYIFDYGTDGISKQVLLSEIINCNY